MLSSGPARFTPPLTLRSCPGTVALPTDTVPPLLLVLDGMSAAVAAQLAEQIRAFGLTEVARHSEGREGAAGIGGNHYIDAAKRHETGRGRAERDDDRPDDERRREIIEDR